MQPKTWRIWLSYMGTRFAGFQKQPDLETVESAVQEALFKLTAQTPVLTPAGRTDAGVHARGQVISCTFESELDSRTLPRGLSHFLGPDLCVYRADEMPASFDAKRQSIGKRYVYRINLEGRLYPFNRLFAWDVRQKLNLEAMQEAANYLVGEHDFESFRSAQCQAEHARRYVWMVDIQSVAGGIEIDIRGNAFCHNMVRIIVGTLVDVGLAKLSPDKIEEILSRRNRLLAGRTAPARGLCLQEVYYPDTLQDAKIPEGACFPRYPIVQE